MSELMPGALAYDGLDASALEALSGWRSFVEREVIPAAKALDAADEYPEEIVAGLCALGVFGFTMPRELGGSGHGLPAYCLAVEELARGWMSVAGIERLYRDAPMLLLGEGTSEIQKTIVARGLVRRWEDEHDGT